MNLFDTKAGIENDCFWTSRLKVKVTSRGQDHRNIYISYTCYQSYKRASYAHCMKKKACKSACLLISNRTFKKYISVFQCWHKTWLKFPFTFTTSVFYFYDFYLCFDCVLFLFLFNPQKSALILKCLTKPLVFVIFKALFL